VYRPAGGSWGPPTNLSNRGGKAADLDLAIARGGDAVALWTQKVRARYADLWSSSRPAGAAHWGKGELATGRWQGLQARVAIDDGGNATVVLAGSQTISASFKPAGEHWQADYLLSSYDVRAVQPAVTTHSSRNATAVWVGLGEEDDGIQSVSYDIDTSAKENQESESEDDSADQGDDEGGDGGDDEGEMFMGTGNADALVGTSGNDVFYGLGGNDVIDGRGGRDVIYGGPGNDRIVGGKGSDRIFGGAGRDRITSGRGRDLVFGGSGNDRIAGERSSDRLFGGAGRDRLSGGRGDDVLVGGPGRDVQLGNTGNDTLLARDRYRDKAFGGSGLDRYRLDRWLDRARSIESRY
jgi:Ca2+-binding RTX toxin-like protein